ncbi:hypothetical protein [Fulvivirga sp.]|uniref:hypothetical protein n=1 Tax=Fulvivirga sp. TaxID=1931237 RepID=UPI0032EEC50F
MSSSKRKKENEVLSEYYVLSEHWKSDFDFYRDELQFLSSLINKYFIYLLHDKTLSDMQKLAERLSKTTQERVDITESIIDYMGKIKSFMTTDKELNANDFQTDHAKLEVRMADFLKSFRVLKKDVFSVTQEILENEKVKKLLSA